MDGWRTDIGYPEDRDRAEERLLEERDESVSEEEGDGETVESVASDES